jgi:hypothetical protein
MEKKLMKKSKIVLLSLVIFALASCVTTEPDNFITFHCVENSSLGTTRNYLIDVRRSTNDTSIYAFSNFYSISNEGDFDIRIKRTNNNLSFSPASQQIGQSQYVIKSGTGVTNDSFTRIDFDYLIFNGKNDVSVKAILTR